MSWKPSIKDEIKFKKILNKPLSKSEIRKGEETMEVVNFMNNDKRKNILMKKTGSKTKNQVELPTYKVEEKDPTYKLRRGKVMEAHSNLHADKEGKRYITTKMKIWDSLTPSDKADLKKSIMLALNHKFKGGSISDFPKEVRGVVNEVFKHMTGGGFFDDLNRVSGKLMPQHTRNLNKAVDKTKQVVSNVKQNVQEVRDATDKMRAARGMGFVENYFKPKGHRQLIYFSDSSSDEDEPHVPVKRGRGRPRCT